MEFDWMGNPLPPAAPLPSLARPGMGIFRQPITAPPTPVREDPGLLTRFWRQMLKPAPPYQPTPDDVGYDPNYNALPGLVEGIKEVPAALTSLATGVEPPREKPPAAKVNPRTNPVPAAGKPDPAAIGKGKEAAAAMTMADMPGIGGGLARAMEAGPVPAPAIENEPAKAPGIVRVTINGKTYDYAQGESIPDELKGRMGPLTEPEGYMTSAGFVKTGEREFGGQGGRGSASMVELSEDSTTPMADQLREEKLGRTQTAADQALAAARAADPFAETKAKAAAEAQVWAARAAAENQYRNNILAEQQQTDQERQALIDQFENEQQIAEQQVAAAEAKAARVGIEREVMAAAKLRERFEAEKIRAQQQLQLRLQSKGVRGVYKPGM